MFRIKQIAKFFGWLERYIQPIRDEINGHQLETILTIATVFLAVYTYNLWDATNGLLKADIEKSAKAAEDMRTSLLLTRQVADAAISQAVATKSLADAATNQANALKEANRLNFSGQRPWILPQVGIDGPITFTNVNDAQMRLNIIWKNVGHLPAVNVVFQMEADVQKSGMTMFNSIPDEKRLCKAARLNAKIDTLMGKPIFPDETSEIIHWNTLVKHPQYIGAWPSTNKLSFKIVGCIDYTFSNGENIHGQTGFSYDLFNIKGPRGFNVEGTNFGIDPNEGTVIPDNLELDIDFFHGNYLK